MLRRISLLFALVMLLGLIAACGGDDDDEDSGAEAEITAAAPSPTADTSPGSQLVEPPEVPAGIPRDGRLLGEPDAAVQIVEYGDFQ